MSLQVLVDTSFSGKPSDDGFDHRFCFNIDVIKPLIERTFREKIGITTFAMRFEIFEVQLSVLANLLLFGEFKQWVILRR